MASFRHGEAMRDAFLSGAASAPWFFANGLTPTNQGLTPPRSDVASATARLTKNLSSAPTRGINTTALGRGATEGRCMLNEVSEASIEIIRPWMRGAAGLPRRT